jgi:hypothetical protein
MLADESPTKSVPESTEVIDDPQGGRFVVSALGWEHAAGVSLSLERVAPAGRVEGGIDPSCRLFDNPVDRLRTRNFLSDPLRVAGVDAVRSVLDDDLARDRESSRTVHAVAGRGVRGFISSTIMDSRRPVS